MVCVEFLDSVFIGADELEIFLGALLLYFVETVAPLPFDEQGLVFGVWVASLLLLVVPAEFFQPLVVDAVVIVEAVQMTK